MDYDLSNGKRGRERLQQLIDEAQQERLARNAQKANKKSTRRGLLASIVNIFTR